MAFGQLDSNTGIMDNNPFDDNVPDAVEPSRGAYTPDMSTFFGSNQSIEGLESPTLSGGATAAIENLGLNVGNDGTISTKSIEGLNPYSSPYTFGTENELGGGLLFPPGGVKEGISLEPLTPEEQIAQYGKEQYGMAGPLPKGYYSGPADRVYKYGEGPFAEQTQQYLDSIGKTADQYAEGLTMQPFVSPPPPMQPKPVLPNSLPLADPKPVDESGQIPTIQPTPSQGIGGLESSQGLESVLSPYVGPYVTELLGKGAALADSPYEAYMGPLTAGESDLQTKAFEGIAGLDIPTDKMGAFNVGTFDASQADKYMNPYLMAALNPQLEEARRQSDIERQRAAGRLLQAGTFGGGRQAVMDAENQRNLLQNLSGITGEGYRDAYDKAMGQFNIEQDRGRGVQEDINRYGLAAVQKAADLGAVQRGIESEGITADMLQFEEERDFPYNQVQYMQQLLSGLPLQTKNFTYTQPTGLEQTTSDVSGIMALINALRG